MESSNNKLSYIDIIKANWIILIVIFSTTLLLGSIYTYRQKDYFRAEAVLTPLNDQGGQSLMSMAASMTGLGGLVGGSGSDSKTKILMALNSRTLSENTAKRPEIDKILTNYLKLIKKLPPNYEQEFPNHLKAAILKGMLKTSENQKYATIIVGIESRDPQITAPLVNAYLDELKKYFQENDVSTTRTKLDFIENELVKKRAEWLKAGKDFSSYYQTNQISSTSAKVTVDVAVDEDGVNNTHLMVEEVPQQVHIKYLQLKNQVLEMVNNSLTEQYISTQIQLAKESKMFRVIDEARIPEDPFKPDRPLMMTLFAFLGVALSALFVFIKSST